MKRKAFFRRAAVTAMFAGCLALPPLLALDAAELKVAVDRLQVLGSVLYVGAHPDDENTSALAYFVKGRKLRAAYLSITRGGGGQNLIGTELGDALAALRTQELLAARRVDGAEQYFTRAVDFGYSKTHEETLKIWGRESVLGDLVRVVRLFRPDVIVSRFSTTAGGGHGHHTAGALLVLEAFSAAGDPSRFPEQLATLKPWQAKRIVWNSWRTPEEREKMPAGSSVAVDVGRFDPLLGKSYTEMGAEGRSMHRSQGFGSMPFRGSRLDYFETLAGEPAKADLFEGVDTTWRRVPGSEKTADLLGRAREAFSPEHPEAALPTLLKAKAELDKLPDDPWVEVKRRDLTEVVRWCAGIWVEAISDAQTAAPGGTLSVAATVVARGGYPVTLVGLTVRPSPTEGREKNVALLPNQPFKESFTLVVPPGTPCSQPYWLVGPRVGGLHCDAPPALAGTAENPPAMEVLFRFAAEGVPFEVSAPVQYRLRDPVYGERYQPLAVVPPVMVNLSQPVVVFGDPASREVDLVVVAGKADVAGNVKIRLPKGFKAEPESIPFRLAKPFDEVRAAFRVTPPAEPQSGELSVDVEVGGATVQARGLARVDYPHVPLQTLFPTASARVVRVDLRRDGRRIGYVMGAGDEIPQCLRPLGYQVELLSDDALAAVDLSGYDAVVAGIRAYNTRPRLAQLNQRLLEYVSGGGTLVVLYNVNQGLVTEAIGPHPFKVSRGRVTEEGAEVRFLTPGHPVLNRPNKITPADFDGWVQERGLYFLESWDPRYTPVLSSNDAGEKPMDGGLVVAAYGKGQFVYTGLAFFRQLPDGVPGAYRLFANLLALGKP